MSRSHGLRFLAFSMAGAVATGVHYAVLVAGVRLAGQNPVRASVLGAACGAVVSYLLNYHLSFRSSADHRNAAARFIAMAGLGFALNYAFMYFLTNTCGTHYLVAQMLATLLVLGVNYLLSAHWVFSRRQTG